MAFYRSHVLVCVDPECLARGAHEVVDALQDEFIAQGLNDEIQVLETSRIGGCGNGPEMMVYPEGVHYGPQLQEEECTGLGLQFQGLTGIPYLTHKELHDARKALAEEGATFADGVCTRVLPDGRKINRDSHLACSEYVAGKRLDFPVGRFEKPIVMRPQAHPWIGDRHLDGVEHKRLGTFGGSGIRFMRMAPGAKIPARREEDAEIRYLIEGSIEYDGKSWQGGQTPDEGTYMFIQPGADVGEIASKTGGVFYVVELPILADTLAQHAREAAAAE